jgi:hypothetical protein
MTPLEFAVLYLYDLDKISVSRALELLRSESPELQLQHIREMHALWREKHQDIAETSWAYN